MSAADERVAREFISAFNDRDLDRFAATLDPEIEIHSMRGLRVGLDEARAWATRLPGGVQQSIEIESITLSGDLALVEIRRHWHWEEDEDHAGTDEMAWLFEFRAGKIRSWRSFLERGDGQAALDTGSAG